MVNKTILERLHLTQKPTKIETDVEVLDEKCINDEILIETKYKLKFGKICRTCKLDFIQTELYSSNKDDSTDLTSTKYTWVDIVTHIRSGKEYGMRFCGITCLLEWVDEFKTLDEN